MQQLSEDHVRRYMRQELSCKDIRRYMCVWIKQELIPAIERAAMEWLGRANTSPRTGLRLPHKHILRLSPLLEVLQSFLGTCRAIGGHPLTGLQLPSVEKRRAVRRTAAMRTAP